VCLLDLCDEIWLDEIDGTGRFAFILLMKVIYKTISVAET
jgi:hypothetical protein